MFPYLTDARPSYVPKYVPDKSCVLYLEGQQDPQSTTIKDLSGYKNHGTITGATWVRLPRGMWVLSFDGTDDFVDCGNNTSLSPTDTISVETWVSPHIIGIEHSLIIKDFGSGVWPYRLHISSNNFYFDFYDTDYRQIISTTTVVAGTWYHVVGTYNRITFNIYVNGVSDAVPVAYTAAIPTNTVPLCLGKQDSGSLFAPVNLGLVRIYNRTLTVKEIASHYNQERSLFGV